MNKKFLNLVLLLLIFANSLPNYASISISPVQTRLAKESKTAKAQKARSKKAKKISLTSAEIMGEKQDFNPGDVINVTVNTQSNFPIKNARSNLSLVFKRPNGKKGKRRILGTVSQIDNTDSANGAASFIASFALPDDVLAGEWRMNFFARNSAGFKKNFKALDIDIFSDDDRVPPKLKLVELPSNIDLLNGDVNVPVKLTFKEHSGVQELISWFVRQIPKPKKNKKAPKATELDRTERITTNGMLLSSVNGEEIFQFDLPFSQELNDGNWFLRLIAKDSKSNQSSYTRQKTYKNLKLDNKMAVTKDGTSFTLSEFDLDLPIFDANGNLINANGDLIDANGSLINSNGDLINSNGDLIDANGDLIIIPEEEFEFDIPSSGGGGGGSNPPPTVINPTPTPEEPNDPPEEEPPEEAPPEPTPEPEFIEENETQQSLIIPPSSQIDISFGSSPEFIFNGENAQQKELDEDVLNENLEAIVRGIVKASDGSPLENVKVSIQGHPEFGYAMTNSIGEYNLVINGGKTYVLEFKQTGCLTIQRHIDVPKHEYAISEDVCLTALDPQVTEFDLDANSMVVAESSETDDYDGKRHVTLMVPAHTHATMRLENGSVQELDHVHFRATEYTVGAGGLEAMPGDLPAASAYTYAAEFSFDEAIAAGAMEINFDQGLPFYVDNFLDFPVGEDVPLGYYDRERATWIAAEDGRIIDFLSVNNARAVIDVTGNGNPATASELEALGVSDAELVALAQTHSPGESLWRVVVDHFTPWDCNWPYGFPGDATGPIEESPDGDITDLIPDDKSKCEGSIIECESQTLGERLPITGTPFSLEYRSDRVEGRKSGRTINIPLSDSNTPDSLKRIELTIDYAGRRIKKKIQPQPNKTFVFTWDGKDAFGREVFGSIEAKIKIDYLYDLVYYPAREDFERAFAVPTDNVLETQTAFEIRRGDTNAKISKTYFRKVSNLNLKDQTHLANWSISPHHLYMPESQTLIKGDGDIVTRESVTDYIFEAGESTFNTEMSVNNEYIYVVNWDKSTISRFDVNNINNEVIVYSRGAYSEFIPPIENGNVASEIRNLILPTDLHATDENDIYFIEQNTGNKSNDLLKVLRANGKLELVAGNAFPSGEYDTYCKSDRKIPPNTKAVGFDICRMRDFTMDDEGNIYMYSDTYKRILKVDPDGFISTFAGKPEPNYSSESTDVPNNIPAKDFYIGHALSDIMFYDDYLYFSGSVTVYGVSNSRVYNAVFRINSTGIVEHVAGTTLGDEGDGLDAKLAKFRSIIDLGSDKFGNIYIGDIDNKKLKKINRDGIISTLAGTGRHIEFGSLNLNKDPTVSYISRARNIYVADDGTITFHCGSSKPCRIKPGLPTFTGDDLYISSKDAAEVYHFDPHGLHLETLNSLTGAVIYSFNYDDKNRLISIVDTHQNTTTIERNADGEPVAIVAPFGQRTELTLDEYGNINSITNPKGETHSASFDDSGLMTSFTNPRNVTAQFEYGNKGRLIKDTNEFGNSWTLDREKINSGQIISMSTTLGRELAHKSTLHISNGVTHTTTYPDGSKTGRSKKGGASTTSIKTDGTVIVQDFLGDDRFAMQAPYASSTTITTPNGLELVAIVDIESETYDDGDITKAKEITKTTTINDKTFTDHYDGDSKTFTHTSAENRISTSVIDVNGLLLSSSVNGLAELSYSYDDKGRLSKISVGNGSSLRETTFAYGLDGYLDSVTNPLGQVLETEHSEAGRVTDMLVNGYTLTQFEYDPNGNMTGLKPPGKPKHEFTFNLADLESEYKAPDLSGANESSTKYSYNSDKDLIKIERADGKNIDFNYDFPKGQLESIDFSQGSIAYTYNATNGQLISMTAPGGESIELSYDGGLITSEKSSGTFNTKVANVYNNDFMLESRSINNGSAVDFAYDDDFLLTQAGNLDISYSSINTLINGLSLDNVSSAYEFNKFGELSLQENTFNTTELYSVDYTRDKLGRITHKTETIQGSTITRTYEYDNENRLAKIKSGASVLQAYSYDENGNRTRSGSLNNPTIATYNDQDRLVSFGATTYTYTKHGDLKSKTLGNSTTNYDYDEFGSLRSVTLPSKNIDYVVDAKHRRIGKKVNGNLVQGFVYKDQINPIAELDASGNIVSRFVYANRMNVPSYMIKGNEKYRIISDHLGSPRLVVNASTGVVAQRIDYDEWGNITQDTNPGFQPFGFAGGIYDADTKLVRFGYRDYDPETGRWTAKDPIRFEGGQANLYVYVGNDPINYIDPLGLYSITGAMNGFGGGIAPGASYGAIGGAFTGNLASGAALGALYGGVTGAIDGFLSDECWYQNHPGYSAAILGALGGADGGRAAIAGGAVAGLMGASLHGNSKLVNATIGGVSGLSGALVTVTALAAFGTVTAPVVAGILVSSTLAGIGSGLGF